MDQEKIGKFIAECRKNKNLTQSQLAEKLEMSDKTISKWETGKGMPDISIMLELCKHLNIDVNELLSGEKLNDKQYIEKTNENILSLVEIQEKSKKKSRKIIVSLFTAITIIIIVSILSIVMLIKYFTVSKTFEYNWDVFLPTSFKEVYHTKDEVSFHGDGERYSVFEGNSFFGKMKDGKNTEMEEIIKQTYNRLEIPKEQQINFDKEYTWIKITAKKDNRSYMYCIYSYESDRYYFYEYFM